MVGHAGVGPCGAWSCPGSLHGGAALPRPPSTASRPSRAALGRQQRPRRGVARGDLGHASRGKPRDRGAAGAAPSLASSSASSRPGTAAAGHASVGQSAGPDLQVNPFQQARTKPASGQYMAGDAAASTVARSRNEYAVSEEQVEAFQRNGAVLLKGILSPSEVRLLRGGIDANLACPSPRAKVASPIDDPGLFIEDFCNWQENDAYRDIIMTSSLAPAAGTLMRSRRVRLHHDHMLTKEGGTRQRTPWHQDMPYYDIEGRHAVSFWVPVDPVTRESSLEFVAGSHLGPWLMPRSFMTDEAKWFPEGSLEELPDVEANRAAYGILGWAVEPGDAVAFHMLTLHAAGGVEPGGRRRVFSVRMVGDDVVHVPRPWVTSPEFPGLHEELPAGALLDHPLFPVLWERRALDSDHLTLPM